MKVVAHHPTTTSVTLWISAGPAERRWSVEVRVRGTGQIVDQWSATRRPDRTLPSGLPGLPGYSVWRHAVSGLAPGGSYDVAVVPTIRSERVVARFETLPQQLPLRILAGSCYYAENDTTILSRLPLRLPAAVGKGWAAVLLRRLRLLIRTLLSAIPRRGMPALLQGGVAQRYRALHADPATRPHLTVLVGDQVYLDAPVREFYARVSGAALARRVARSYQRSWEMLGEFLTLGANVLVSDDHEFWNDYPNEPALLWRSLADPGARAAFEDAAHDHLRWMQLARPTYSVAVARPRSRPQLAIFVADTRIHRTTADGEDPRFMAEDDFDELLAWLWELRSPGVLFLGQPLIVGAAGAFDDNLRSYTRQYGELCAALAGAAHDVVVVCGDAHFGRVVTIDVAETGRRHVEVISSPLTVLDGAEAPVSCGLDDGLDVFPPGGADQTGVAKQVNAVPGRHDGAVCEDHAMLLGFEAGGDGAVVCSVGAYLMRHVDGNGGPALAWTERFDLR
ncbi:hypothetical protein [Actinomycetospora sp. TBRC 11914]|uniref:hypothetical protein n=1 Tax=Actinomycetospora sp. TBRC 11914 TaxID=2729387 RepID=UPI00145E0199|nr:hypothetical protein [Actinomycetospora sp. TBRC 11914]NMO90310.1 hypothetical protein [Actinomycetospora sp. TBRC 11914]